MKNNGFERRILCQIGKKSQTSPYTPSKKHIYSERFVPSTLSAKPSESVDWYSKDDCSDIAEIYDENAEYANNQVFQDLLANETINRSQRNITSARNGQKTLMETTNYFTFKRDRRNPTYSLTEKYEYMSWHASVLSEPSRRLLENAIKKPRKISKTPYKTLDAPELKDDFYLNLLDWSSFDNLAVGLGRAVYIWNSKSSAVVKLCELESPETVTAVSCSPLENNVAVATNLGKILIYSVEEGRELQNFKPHSSRIGSLTWNNTVLASGSRDKSISLLDMRCCGLGTSRNPEQENYSRVHNHVLKGHKQEVCGLRFSPDGRYLASGGNDNKLLLWDVYGSLSSPAYKFSGHKAAVKALAWSPHKRGLLASGGGTADQEIRFWNSLTGQALSNHKTESQICNMVWSKNTNELVTTHGFSYNELIVWKYPIMSPVVKLSGHTSRVLYMALSPDGRTVVTGSGDETLRFWDLFDSTPPIRYPYSVLTLDNYIR